ncbi:AMP-binding protein [Streptomyces alanosinicus]|uniref:Acetyl-CoA synthetase n=1 Tax=Streptomyces alanosinicus TaxID=68171 RepID=A0A918YRE7_9ACTN|nr:AMP-binding protein [Streptomyces alanosinicus]GHE12653.1 acetyl-CoA synthetase [Streptomyces alanosinicus]
MQQHSPSIPLPSLPSLPSLSPQPPLSPLSPTAYPDTFARDSLPPPGEWPVFRFDLPELRYPDRLNSAAELLDRAVADGAGGRPCLTDASGTTWSYAETLDLAARIGTVLVRDMGLVPGNRVLLRGPNSPWLAACWLAVLRVGGIAVSTVPMLRAGELADLAERARIRLSLCEEGYADELTAAGTGRPVLTYRADDGGELGRRAAGAAWAPAARTAADDVALIAFTSGTSGEPKATAHFHRDVLAIADTFARHVLHPRPDDVFAGSPPLAFTFGLGGLLIFPLRARARAVLLQEAGPRALFGAVRRLGVTVLFTAPTAYRAVLPEIGSYDLGGLRLCVSAGEALGERTWRDFRDATGLEIIDGIGSTEMLHVFIAAAGDDIRPGSTGRAVPGYRARIVDDTGRELPDGVPGRLAVQGPTGCRYLADPRQRRQVQDGWNLTGDVYVRDADGYFWYQARADDMIVSAGYNIAAPEVEQALLRHPAVAECGVAGAPDAERGTVVKAFVLPAPGVRPSPELARELQDFTKRQIAPYKYPRQIEFVAELPYSTTGKLRRVALRQAGAPA